LRADERLEAPVLVAEDERAMQVPVPVQPLEGVVGRPLDRLSPFASAAHDALQPESEIEPVFRIRIANIIRNSNHEFLYSEAC
jgi:hypothetical protein